MSYKLQISDLAGQELGTILVTKGVFNNNHEAYGVLKEEIEECEDELISINKQLKEIWECVKTDKDISLWAESLENTAMRLAEETIQVIAVCRKIRLMDEKEDSSYG